jgi:hypothetical protein
MLMLVVLASVAVLLLAAYLAERKLNAALGEVEWRVDRVGDPSPPAVHAVVHAAAASAIESDDELAEAVLAASVAAGYLSQARYRRAMEILAAQDAQRHPLVVPPEPGA